MLAEVEKLQKEKYQSWEWNFGNAPAFEYKNDQRYPFGKLEIQANIKKGLIEECKISGDFMGMADLDPLEETLVGVRYAPEDVRKVLDDLELSLYLGGITSDEFIQCLFEGTHVD